MKDKEFDTTKYVEQMSLLLDLRLPSEYFNGVVENFERIRVIAEIVNEFPLPEEVETAPIFEA